jgi:hypothetical protein
MFSAGKKFTAHAGTRCLKRAWTDGNFVDRRLNFPALAQQGNRSAFAQV